MINTTNLASLSYVPPSQQGGQTANEPRTESTAAARDNQQANQRTLNSDAVNRQYVERLASTTNPAALSNRSKRALGAYNSVAQFQERDYVSRIMGISETA